MSKDIDLVNRDPNDLNNHIQVKFKDVLGEPEGVRSIDFCWKCAYCCFECGKSNCYKIMTFLCGICIALAWGCEFALVAFNHVWCFTTRLRDCTICLGCAQKCFGAVLNCCLTPICEACGAIFSKIKIHKKA